MENVLGREHSLLFFDAETVWFLLSRQSFRVFHHLHLSLELLKNTLLALKKLEGDWDKEAL